MRNINIKTYRKFMMDMVGDGSAFYIYYNHFNWHVFTICQEGLFLNSGLDYEGFERNDDGLYIFPDCDVI